MNTRLSRYEVRGAIVGMVLGDSYLHQAHKRENVRMTYSHSPKQAAYGYWKGEILESLLSKPIKAYTRFAKLGNGKSYEQVMFESISHPLFKRLRKIMYPNGKKRVSGKVLSYLTPLGLAIWYMDDGSVSINKRDGKLRGRNIYLHTACDEEQADIIRNYFLCTWGIEWKKFKVRKDGYRVSLFAGVESAIKFFRLISQNVHPSLRYKIDLQYHNQASPMTERIQQRIADLKAFGLYFKSDEIVPTPTTADNLLERAA